MPKKKKNVEEEKAIEVGKKKRGFFKRFFTGKNLLITILVVMFLMQYMQIRSIFGTTSLLEGHDTSLITEIGQIKEAYLDIGGDMNEIREFLRLPTKNYAGFTDDKLEGGEENEDSNKNENEIQLALFKYVDFLSTTKNNQKLYASNSALLSGLIKNEAFVTFASENGLALNELSEDESALYLYVDNSDGKRLVTYKLLKDDSKIYRMTVNTKKSLSYEKIEDFVNGEKVYLTQNKDKIAQNITKINKTVEAIATTIAGSDVQDVIAELGVSLSAEAKKDELKLRYTVKNGNEDPIGEIVFDKASMKITLVDLKDSSLSTEITDISTALIPFLKKLDNSTFIEKKYKEALTSLNETINDKGFKLILDQNGFTISPEPREDNDRIYYDLLDKDGNVISMLVVEKMTGVVNIVQPDGTNAENLLFFDPEFKKKTLDLPELVPDYSDDLSHESHTFNILIAGKHDSLVDTMIFAHIDEDRGDVRMISIPRDLFYNGRKINALPVYYGMPELKKVLSDMTGYKLDKYILIDMYAFIDIIDLVGGIDIHLDSPVIDPTYRTVDNGVVGTLHYEPGDYHLGGVEALRLARTRHTSSDFARAERQQMIIEAIQDKARNFGFGDADTIYEIAKTVLAKTETDIELEDAIAYYFRYQNLDIVSNNVMSSGNVLYVPPYITVSNCEKAVVAAKAAGQSIPGCMNENHAYTLLPKNNNWNIIKWYFRENFEDA